MLASDWWQVQRVEGGGAEPGAGVGPSRFHRRHLGPGEVHLDIPVSALLEGL